MTASLIPSQPMSLKEFGGLFAKLAMQLRWTDADEAAIRSYYDAMKGCSYAAVRDSATRFAREPGRRYFPTTGEWYASAGQCVTESLRKALPAARDEPWHSDCSACEDAGWEYFACPGDTLCGRRMPHAAHPFVRICRCRPTNATYQRHQQIGRHAGD